MNSLRIPILLALGLILPVGLHAAVVDVNGTDPLVLSPALGNPAAEEAYVESTWAGGADLTFLQKWNTDGTGFSETPGIGSYSFSPSGNVATSTVSWNLSGTGYLLSYILLKDGNSQQDGGFLYNLYSVSTDMGLTGSSLLTINGAKGISHYTFFGTLGGSNGGGNGGTNGGGNGGTNGGGNGGTTVPDGGNTILLLGCVLGLLALFQRRLAFS